MQKGSFLLAMLFVGGHNVGFAQSPNPAPAYSADPIINMSTELTNISRSVQTLSERMKVFVDKFEKVGGLTMTDKQQKLILGMELLVRAEQRVATLQKSQIELVEKQNETRGKLSQAEIELRPRNIDRSVTFEGTTETEELRDSKRQKLQAERSALIMLMSQIQTTLVDTTDALREAQNLVFRLRKTFLPQIERELYDQ